MNTSYTGATLSPDGLLRWDLWRRWASVGPTLTVIGLNPSTADATADDPTIRRCIGFAKRESCSALVMLNLVPFRATRPEDMLAWLRSRDRGQVLADNASRMERWIDGPVVAAWGALDTYRSAELNAAMDLVVDVVGTRRLLCLGRTKSGQPRHPLYLRADAPLERWRT